MAENPTVTSNLAPMEETIRVQLDPVATAGNDATTEAVASAPFACTLKSAAYLPSGAATADATNHRTWAVVDENSGDSMATFTCSTTSLVADTKQALTLSATASNLNIAAGDRIKVTSTHVGTGVADPGGVMELVLERA